MDSAAENSTKKIAFLISGIIDNSGNCYNAENIFE